MNMSQNSRHSSLSNACRATVAAFGLLGLAACVQNTPPPKVVDKSAPTITYKYSAENGLVEATQKAEVYCQRYQAWPRTHTISDNRDGSKSVVFECSGAAPPAPMQPVVVTTPQSAPQPLVSYTVRTDQELVNALRNANAYCRQKGMRSDTASITRNADGTRMVAFRCIAA
jgi:putative hemolysin